MFHASLLRVHRCVAWRVAWQTAWRIAGYVACALLLSGVFNGSSCGAQVAASVAERYLLAATNAERALRHLPALRWDGALYQAAREHAQRMALDRSIAHQYNGELELAARARLAGARFSVIAENVGSAETAVDLHTAWMHSEHHRDNLLDPQVNTMAISVVRRGDALYAVEDFERSVAVMSFAEQEEAVGELLTHYAGLQNIGLQILSGEPEARATCKLSHGYAGEAQPWFIMRFTAGELNTLPGELREKLATGRYRRALVGACPSPEGSAFSSYAIAVLLFP